MQKLDCSHLLVLMFAEYNECAEMRLRLLSNLLPSVAERKSETLQRAEVKSFCSLVLDSSLAETLFRSLCTEDFNKHLQLSLQGEENYISQCN